MSILQDRLQREKDNAIRAMWRAFRDLSELLPPDDWTEEDMDLWGKVTEHSAVQNRIRQGKGVTDC